MIVPLTPLRCLERAVDIFGARTGIVCGGREFTYSEFGDRCGRLASGLRKLGVAAQERVAFLSFNTHKLLEGYYGVVQAGAIVMPLNVRLSPQELVDILNHAEAAVLCFENDFAGLIEQFRQTCPSIRQFVALDDPAAACIAYEDVLGLGRPERADIMSVDENAVAELFYTSGSTGTPKGVMLTHRNLYVHALMVATTVEEREAGIDLHTIPMFHANGWGRPQTSTMLGAKQVMVRRFAPTAVFELVQKHRATEMCLVPTMANLLLNAPDRGAYDLSSLRAIMIGGAAASPELIERMELAFGCNVRAGYGLTETCPVLTMSLPKGLVYADDQERYRRQAMAGWPIAGAEIRVAGLSGEALPRDGKAVGEILARGDGVMLGYYRDEAATKAVIRDGWFHTGDLAVWDEEGFVHIVDRMKEIIISGGENISSIEVERAIFSHPDVFECAVVAAPDPQWGEVPAAVVVLKPGAGLDEASLLAYLENILGRFKLPRRVEFSNEPLPKTGTGKVRKMAIKRRFWE